jgi:pilus assembly protein FimV
MRYGCVQAIDVNKRKILNSGVNHPLRPQIRATVCAAVLVVCLPVQALGLGAVALKSKFGQPLQAEIALTDLSVINADQLRAKIASAETYRRAGLEYKSVLQSLQIEVQMPLGASPILLVRSSKGIEENFLDLIVELSWPTGQMTKDYALLFDPQLKQTTGSEPFVPSAPIGSAASPAVDGLPAPQAVVQPAQTIRAQTSSTVASAAALMPQAAGGPIMVRYGDTAAAIARKHASTNVSLDQMLLAMVRSNAHAFVKNNVNRLRSDVNLSLPTEASARAIDATEARQEILLQAKGFDEYRQQMTQSVGLAPEDKKDRHAAGPLSAGAATTKPLAVNPGDKLTLSNQLRARDAGVQEKISGKTDAEETLVRLSAVSQDLTQIKGMAEKQLSAGSATSLAPPSSVSTPPANSKAQEARQSPGAGSLSAAASVGDGRSVAVVTQKNKNESNKNTTQSALEDDSSNWVAWIIAAFCALSVGVLIGRLVKAKKSRPRPRDSIFAPTKQKAEVFFNATGGREVDAVAMALPAQVDKISKKKAAQVPTGGGSEAMQIDPLAEADVYLAYGREQQAEEILREALQQQPLNQPIALKLIGIYAQRGDVKAFNKTALKLHQLTLAQGDAWSQVAQLGQKIAPSNPLYQAKPPAQPTNGAPAGKTPALAMTESTQAPTDASTAPERRPELLKAEAAVRDAVASTKPGVAALAAVAHVAPSPSIAEGIQATSPADGRVGAAVQALMLDGMASKSNVATPIKRITTRDYDPQQIKLDLAKEFIGSNDFEGARELIDEIASDASPELRQQALQLREQLPKSPNSEQLA